MRRQRPSLRPIGWIVLLFLGAFVAGCAGEQAGGEDAGDRDPAATDHDGGDEHDGGTADHDEGLDHDGGTDEHDATVAADPGDGDGAAHGDHGEMTEGEVQRYAVKGVVLAVDPTKPGLIVRHEEIVGFMGGMTMNFSVDDPAVLERFEGNETIEATLVYDGENGWLEEIEIVEPDEDADQE